MDWVQIVATLSAGAGGVLTIQKIIKGLSTTPPDKPVRPGERREILSALQRLEQASLDGERAMGRIESRLDEFDDRLRPLERAFARWREHPRADSTD
jgi:hypothetical protein